MYDMIVFRAMCNEEYERTIKLGCADFSKKRFKWFSNNINFILDRVGDGQFNNSKFCPDRYTRIVEFSIDDKYVSKLDHISKNEIQVDRRRNIPITVCRVLK